jgi:hypothetical protein
MTPRTWPRPALARRLRVLLGARGRAAGMDCDVCRQETTALRGSLRCEEQHIDHLLQETW